LYNLNIFILSEVPEGGSVKMGVKRKTDKQSIAVSSSQVISTGNVTLRYGDTYGITFSHNSNLLNWGNNLKNAINSHPDLSGVEVSTFTDGTGKLFEFMVSFERDDDYRFHELLTVHENNISNSQININKERDGSPINSVPFLSSSERVKPNDVVFDEYNSSNTLFFKELKSGDGIPIWIERSILPNTEPIANDGFTLRIIGETIL
jgi:hypothetical protein